MPDVCEPIHVLVGFETALPLSRCFQAHPPWAATTWAEVTLANAREDRTFLMRNEGMGGVAA